MHERPDLLPTPRFTERARAYSVHLLTASGIACAFFALMEICSPHCDPRIVFIWLALQVLIDAVDGPLARRWKIKIVCPEIDGRTIDDLVDYNTYTLIPLLLIYRMDWLPGPDAAWLIPAAIVSLFGFANRGAKDEANGFFLGFPSYWDIVALYVGIWFYMGLSPWIGAFTVALCIALTVLPVRFVYPNLAPHPWRRPTLIGSVVFAALLAWLVAWYVRPVPMWLMLVSLVYPAAYIALSIHLDLRLRRRSKNASAVTK